MAQITKRAYQYGMAYGLWMFGVIVIVIIYQICLNDVLDVGSFYSAQRGLDYPSPPSPAIMMLELLAEMLELGIVWKFGLFGRFIIS
jgi:hypothetical protein